jgi:tyrosyl-tRNA synthetase
MIPFDLRLSQDLNIILMHYGQLSIGNVDVFKELRYWNVINHMHVNCSVSVMINSDDIAVKQKTDLQFSIH